MKEAPTEDLVSDDELKATKINGACRLASFGRDDGSSIFRLHVNELDDPIRVGAGGRGKEVRDDISRDTNVLLQRLGFPCKYIRTMIDETLILH